MRLNGFKFYYTLYKIEQINDRIVNYRARQSSTNTQS